MRQDHRFQRKGKFQDGQKRMLPVILIPLIVIILMIVIVVADHSGEKDPEPEESLSPSAAETMVPGDGGEPGLSGEAGENPEGADSDVEVDPEPEKTQAELFLADGIPEIQELLTRYYKARAAADAETVNAVYGITDVPAAALADQKARMGNNAKYISDISNVATYIVNGQASGSWLVYSTAEIKFYTAKTAVPMIMWCYVKQNLEGNYLIVDNASLTQEQLQLVDQVSRSLEVRALASNINNQLKEALASDEDLREVYGILHDGSPVWADVGETTAEVVILDGSAQEEQTEGGEGAVPEAPESTAETPEAVPESAAETVEAGTGDMGTQETDGQEGQSSESAGD